MPRRLPADERRAQILHASAQCFGTHGFRGTTTRDVAAAVGITEAALYRYFPSKEAIYAAILDERIAAPDPIAHLEAAAREKDDAAVFSGLARTLLGSIEADPSFLRLLLYSALEGHEMARPFQETRIRSVRSFLAAYIARRTRDGAFRKVDAAIAARAFVGMLMGHLISRQVFGHREPDEPSAETVADGFVAIFLAGVRRVEPAGATARGAGAKAAHPKAKRGRSAAGEPRGGRHG